jgi:hypothetical protein
MKRKSFYTVLALMGVFMMIDLSVLAQSTGTSSSKSSSRSREASRARVVIPPVPDLEGIELYDFDHGFAYTTSSSEKNSKLSLSKRYEGATTTKKGSFNVDEGVKKIRISISGNVESGKINVELYLPNNKEVGKFLIDDTADVHWSQSINVEEEESAYYGEWTFVIRAEEAYGSYVLSLSTY